MIALALEKWNFHKRLALWIVLAIGTQPQRIVLGFMTATAFMSMWISNTASTMMMLPVAMAVVRQIALDASLNGEKNDATRQTIENGLGLVLTELFFFGMKGHCTRSCILGCTLRRHKSMFAVFVDVFFSMINISKKSTTLNTCG